MQVVQLQIKSKKLAGIPETSFADIFEMGLKSYRTFVNIDKEKQCFELVSSQLSHELTNQRDYLVNKIQDLQAQLQTSQQLWVQSSQSGIQMCEKIDKLMFCSQKKGQIAELQILNLLKQHFPGAVISDTTKQARMGDIEIINNNVKTLIEIKNYTQTVPTCEVEKFLRDADDSDADNYIFVSIGQRIAGKPRVSLEYQKGKPALYLSDFNSECDQILVLSIILLANAKPPAQSQASNQMQSLLKNNIQSYRKLLIKQKQQLEKQLKDVQVQLQSLQEISDQLKPK